MTEVTRADRDCLAKVHCLTEDEDCSASDQHYACEAIADHRIAATAILSAENEQLKARVAELEGVLLIADNALCNYACHAGPQAPCLRAIHQCSDSCGKVAGDAVATLRAALKDTGHE